jgi:hypothetical protein
VFSFKHPSATELEHDFLWRTTRDLPERGRIGIFNRSYYEEVLILRVHRAILLAEGLPDPPRHDKKLWHGRSSATFWPKVPVCRKARLVTRCCLTSSMRRMQVGFVLEGSPICHRTTMVSSCGNRR